LPDILSDGKYLDVGTLAECGKRVRKRNGRSIYRNKVLFTSGNVLNTAMSDDDLDLRRLTDKRLEFLSGAGGEKKVIFLPASHSPDAWSFTGSYPVKENAVTIKVNLKKDKLVKHQFEMTGTKDKLNELVDAIIKKALEWIGSNP
jgi:hypothetical protein